MRQEVDCVQLHPDPGEVRGRGPNQRSEPRGGGRDQESRAGHAGLRRRGAGRGLQRDPDQGQDRVGRRRGGDRVGGRGTAPAGRGRLPQRPLRQRPGRRGDHPPLRPPGGVRSAARPRRGRGLWATPAPSCSEPSPSGSMWPPASDCRCATSTCSTTGTVEIAPVAGLSWAAFASTVAAGRLLGLDGDGMAQAFGITVATAPLPIAGQWGNLPAPRPMTKYGMYGTMAEAGVTAARLAAGGLRRRPHHPRRRPGVLADHGLAPVPVGHHDRPARPAVADRGDLVQDVSRVPVRDPGPRPVLRAPGPGRCRRRRHSGRRRAGAPRHDGQAHGRPRRSNRRGRPVSASPTCSAWPPAWVLLARAGTPPRPWPTSGSGTSRPGSACGSTPRPRRSWSSSYGSRATAS